MNKETPDAFVRSCGRGFTILEILITVGIIGILAGIGVTLYNNWYDPRARSAEVVEQYDAMRTRFEEDYRANGQRADCSGLRDLAKGNLDSRYVDLALTTLPMDKNAPDKGHRLALAVSGTVDKHQPRGVRIARAVHDNLVKSGAVMPDAILSDSVVLFALRLTDGPMCQVAMGPVAPGAVVSASAGPPAGQAPSFRQAPQVVAPPQPVAQRIPRERVCRLVTVPPPDTSTRQITSRPGLVVGGSVDPNRPLRPPPQSKPLPAGSAPGSECIVCGDVGQRLGCSDPDLILAITAKCPDDKPMCANYMTYQPNGVVDESGRSDA